LRQFCRRTGRDALDGSQVEEIIRSGIFTPTIKPLADVGPMIGAPA